MNRPETGNHAPVSSWTPDELTRIGQADEVEIAPERGNGTLRRPTTVWVVPHGEDLYVRAAYGPNAVWYRAARARHRGNLRAAGVDRDVTFVEVPADDPVNDRIDAGYRSKYHDYGPTYVDMMLTPRARAATFRLEPA